MRINLSRIAIALTLMLSTGALRLHAQQTFTIASNLPPVLSMTSFPASLPAPSDTFNVYPFGLSTNITGGTPAYSYLWTPGDGLNDATLLSPTIQTFFDLTLHTFVFTVTDANGCYLTDSLTIDYTTEIQEGTQLPVAITVYPNPSAGSFSVDLKFDGNATVAKLFVSDMFGRTIYNTEVHRSSSAQHQIDLGTPASGLYFLGVSVEGKSVVRPIIIR